MLAKMRRRVTRKQRVRSKISGTAERPRLAVFRSNTHISVQLIDDTKWITLTAHSDLKITDGNKTERAKEVWIQMAEKIKGLNLDTIVFDRGGFRYHGRVKALADALRNGGIKF